ncbi:hypothetical protein YWIDRAFT_08207 [Streptomyces sp. SceaMP-e96]|uniref:hypothetical protein n=1 Tax=unclassified Streptomyces TaxID=2593676 RepID=UPI000823BF4B|nr:MULTISPECIES: hypothetical protein [unclassified Streptomyces]MYT18480.1 hypothetical protein [Streptomyces sp. SID4951]SCK57047.1 hypothetical protein YWIDRAFT_08207 [Streptomyces sp. SceaMP-e96]
MNRSKVSRKKTAKQAAAVVALGGFFALSLWLGDEVWDLAAYWPAAGIVCAGVALVSALAVSRAIPGKRSSNSCLNEWQPCWVNHLYPGAFFVTIGSLAATATIMTWLPRWMPKLRAQFRR